MEEISIESIKPVGQVVNTWKDVDDSSKYSGVSVIKINRDYLPAMHLMDNYSHFWILCWFHQADRSMVQLDPSCLEKGIPQYGLFGIRTPFRPNPIGLTLVELIKIDGDTLYVSGLDAIDGTAVWDIKPYYDADLAFSAKTRYIHFKNADKREEIFRKYALAHHNEECLGFELGLRIALLVDEHFGHIQSPDLKIMVKGDACLADVLQGLARARIANPARFSYYANTESTEVFLHKHNKSMRIIVKQGIDKDTVKKEKLEALFTIEIDGEEPMAIG